MSARETAQNGYWNGGALGGVEFFPLTLDRMEILRNCCAGLEDGLEISRVGLAVYTMSDEDAADFRGWGTRADLSERLAEVGRYSPAMLELFQPHFEGDMGAIGASLVAPKAGKEVEGDEGK